MNFETTYATKWAELAASEGHVKNLPRNDFLAYEEAEPLRVIRARRVAELVRENDLTRADIGKLTGLTGFRLTEAIYYARDTGLISIRRKGPRAIYTAVRA
jgi:hypothetical protein